MIPLLSLTRKPIVYRTFSYGGDDFLGFYEDFIPDDDILCEEKFKIRQKYADVINSKEEFDPSDLHKIATIETEYELCKEKIIMKCTKKYEEYAKFILSDNIPEIYSPYFDKKYHNYTEKNLKINLEIKNNEFQRLKLVETLGGEEFCKTIPIIYPKKMCEYMFFNVSDIPEGNSFTQYEDLAGRKGLLVKLKNKNTGKICVAWFHQRRRETCVMDVGGGLWMGNGACGSLEGIDKIIKFLVSVKSDHKIFEISK